MAEFNDIETQTKIDEAESETRAFSPIYSYSQKIDRLVKEGKIKKPKYRTLSQEQYATYYGAKDIPGFDKLKERTELNKAKENTFFENMANQAAIEVADMLSFDNTRLAIGNMLVTGDYTPLTPLATGFSTVAAGIVGALMPTPTASEAEERAILEQYMTPEQKAEREQQAREFYDDVKGQLKEKGYTEEEIEGFSKDTKVQELGRVVLQNAWDDIQYKAAISPQVDEKSVAAAMTSGAFSFGELFAIGAGAKMLGGMATKAILSPVAAEKGISSAALNRFAATKGGKIASGAVTTEMTSEIMGGGAFESIKKYIEDTGDTKLEYYDGDAKGVALDALNATIQNIIEYKLGVNRFFRNPRAASKYGEWLNGFAQEFTQGGVNDIFEFIKGDQKASAILENLPQNLLEGLIGAILQGGTGTAIYHYYHTQGVNQLTDIIMSQATEENPISEQDARAFAEKKIVELEEGLVNDMTHEIIDFAGASKYEGQIYNTVRDNVSKAIEAQREQMKDTLEGSQYDEMTEDELAQTVESIAQDMTDRAVIDALDRQIPLAESPILKGETIDGTYYIEGSDFARQNRRTAEKRRQAIREEVYAAKNAAEDAKTEVKKLREEMQAKESMFLTPKEIETKETLKTTSKNKTNEAVKALTDIGLEVKTEQTDTGETQVSEHTSVYFTVLDSNGNPKQYRVSYDTKADRAKHPNVVATFYPGTSTQEIVQTVQNTVNQPLGKEIIKVGAPEVNEYESILYKERKPNVKNIQFQESFDLADENARLDDIYPEYTGETIEVDGKERTVYNSNGDRIAKSAEALRNFYKWFGDSKVVDEQGRPLVVYHGTSEQFDTFNENLIGKWDYGYYGKGFYFTDHEHVAEDYAKSGAFDDGGTATVMPVYLNLQNPFFMEYTNDNGISDEKHNRLVEQGYDGVIAVESRDLRKSGYEEELNKAKALNVEHWQLKDYEGNVVGRVLPFEFVAWENTQIKSVDNRGTFSEKTGNIYFQYGKGGAYDPRTRSITLGAKANITTIPHELAHYWIDKNFKWARSGKASQAWLRQWLAVEKWLGIDPEDKYLPSAANEKFARAYERFLAEEPLPLVLQKSMADFRDFVLDHYDYELDDAKGLQDNLGRPIRLNEDVKAWFRKSIYESYVSPDEQAVVNDRLALADKEAKDVEPQIKEQQKIESIAENSKEISSVAPTGKEIQSGANVSNSVVLGKKTIGGGEIKQSKGKIAQAIGKTYEATNWDAQEEMVSVYLEKVSVDEALDALDNETYPDKIDANFLRQALVEKLLEEGRELEAAALIEETADDFTESAQKLQAARRINTPFTNAIRMLTVGKAMKLAEARYGKNKDAVKALDSAINALVTKYEQEYANAKTDEERELVFATMQDEAIRTIGSLDKDTKKGLSFQEADDKEERKQTKAIRKRQIKRASIKAYRSRAKRALKQALGLEPTREQVRQIKKLAAGVASTIRDYRKAVKDNKASAIDPTAILLAQNKLNEYMNQQLPPRVLTTVTDAINNYMMANMLWNPATNVFNIESTWVQMIPHMLGTYINYGKGTIPWKEKIQLIKQALALQAKTGYNIFSLRDFFDKKTLWAEKFYEPKTIAGKIQSFPLTMLGLADTANKGIVFLQRADAMATKQAKEEGKGAERAKELFYQALNTDPRTITIDGLKIREAAVKEGEEATFTQMTRTAELVNKFRKLLNFGQSTGVGTLIMPFTTTISNIAEDTVKNYMFGSVRGVINAPKALATQFDKSATAEMKKEAWKAVAPETKNVIKNVIGVTMLLSIALSGADDEDYVLGYDRQTEMDKDIRQNRNAPSGYAIRIGNKWIDLDLFGIGSPWARAYLIAKRDGFTPDGWVKGFASNIDLVPGIADIQQMYDNYSQVKTWSGDWEALSDLGSDKLSDVVERLIPAQALFNEIGNITDTSKRVAWEHWYSRAISKIPGLRKILPERTSKQTGEVIPQTDVVFNLLTGQRVKEYIPATSADIARYEFALSGKALSYRESNSKLKELGKDTEEYNKAISRVRKLFTADLERVAKTSKYKNASIEEKRKIANTLHRDALETVKDEYGLGGKKK